MAGKMRCDDGAVTWPRQSSMPRYSPAVLICMRTLATSRGLVKMAAVAGPALDARKFRQLVVP
jgi:hypothetical protein